MSGTLQYILTDPIKMGLIWCILGLAIFISYRVLDIADLSVEGVLPVSAIMSILCINNGFHPLLALLISILVGIVCGLITSSLSLYLKIPPLLSGIIMMTVLFTVVLVTSNSLILLDQGADGKSLATIFTPFKELFSTWFNNTYWGNFAGIVLVLLIFVGLTSIGLYWFFGTNVGVAIRATGKNVTMAKAQSINTNAMFLLGMGLSSGLVGLAGGLLGQFQGQAEATMGKGTIVIGLAILFLGEVVLRKKTFKTRLISVVLGGYIYWLIMSLIIIIPNFNTFYLYAVQGAMIVIIMSVPYISKKLKKARKETQKCLK